MWKHYCKIGHDTLVANLHNWKQQEYRRPITRLWYVCVHASGLPNPNPPLISEQALRDKEKGLPISDDHCYAPEKRCYMIMDNPDKYLFDYNIFENLFFESTRTIKVSKEENKLLSKLNNVPVHQRYAHLGIVLRERKEGNNRWTWDNTIPYENNVLEQMEDFIEYERINILPTE